MGSKLKWVLFVVIFVLVLAFGWFGYNCFFNNYGNSRIKNEVAVKNPDKRYLSIINKTGQIINEVHVYTGKGSDIESMYQKNPDETSFSIKIPQEYFIEKNFTVKLVDRYNTEYETTIKNVKPKGRTEVVITKGDELKNKDSVWNDINRFFNGD